VPREGGVCAGAGQTGAMDDDTPTSGAGSDDPFAGLPPEIASLLRQLGDPASIQQLGSMLFNQPTTGPVNWDLARQAAVQLAADGDRAATDAEVAVVENAHRLAEHWLDGGALPTPASAARLTIVTRVAWVQAALEAMAPLVEPVADAATRAMAALAQDQLEGGMLADLGLEELLGPGSPLANLDPMAMLRPIGATLSGIQAGQVLGHLGGQLLGQYDLGIPTAPRDQVVHIAVNAHAAFDGWGLDDTEVAIVLLLVEGAHRRLYHAVPWLEGHVHDLVGQFAAGLHLDAERLQSMASELMADMDPDDPASMQQAMERAASFTIEPTVAQQRVLSRLQATVALVHAWARQEARRAAADRLPNLARVEEVLRRRRTVGGEGDRMLASLLGLDLRPPDDDLGDAFVARLEATAGADALHRALAHPENLPDLDELADPAAWLARLAGGDAVPDDLGGLFDGLGDAPREPSATERIAGEQVADDDGPADDGRA